MVSGGAKIDKNILEDFRTMGFRAIQGYGMTETAPIIAFNVPGREDQTLLEKLSQMWKLKSLMMEKFLLKVKM